MKTKITILMICLIVPFFGISAITVYVNSNTGNDVTGNGTEFNPYKTFHKGYTEIPSGGTLDLTGTFTWTDADETGDVVTSGYTISKDITIQGQGADQTIIQAATAAGTADRRIFTISSSYTVNINDVTLRYGYLATNGRGGAVYVGTITTDVTIEGCILEYNEASAGSYTYSYGGGALCYYNSSASGGQLKINNSIIRHNASNNCWGGAIYCYRNTSGTGSVMIENSTISENTAANGTALSGYYGAYIITNSTITANYPSYCIIMSNHDYGLFYMTNVTFAYNDLGASARGLYLENVPDIRIKNSILAQNKRTDNSIYDYYRTGGVLNGCSNNLIEFQGVSDFTNGVDGNIIGEQDCLGITSTLGQNGSSGISPTLALTANSVAINGGTTTANGSVSIPVSDQRGTARVGLPDIGAYEFTGTPATPDIVVSETGLTGFDYYVGSGPSAEQSYTVSGQNLVDDMLITPGSNYEVSDGGAYASSITLTPSGGTVSTTTIYVRLKAGYSAGSYNQSVVMSTSCDEETITLNGTVSAVPPSTYIWTGGTSSNWNTGSNWSGAVVPTSAWHVVIPAGTAYSPEVNNSLASPALCNNLTVNSGAILTILANSGITISGNINNEGTINIESTALGEGSLLLNGSLSGAGTYNVERFLTASQWHLVSSPITNALAGVFEDIWLRYYDESTNTFGSYIQPPSTPMPNGQGFGVWAPTTQTRTFTGTINNGSVVPNVQLTGSAGPNTGWNLIGNPYPSAIDWDAASGWTRSNIADVVYVWNGTQYAGYVGGIPVNGGSRYVAPGQGFFVQATSPGVAIGMNNGIRLHNGVSYLKEASEPLDIIRVSITGNSLSDEAVLAVRPGVQSGYDPMYDAVKLYGSSEAPSIYTLKTDDSEMAINCQNSVSDIIGKTVHIIYAIEGEHIIRWSHTITGESIPVLYDNLEEMVIQPEEPYVYVSSFLDPEDRFTFIEMTNAEFEELSIIYSNICNDVLRIFGTQSNTLPNVQVYNVQGQKVLDFVGTEHNVGCLSAGLYVVHIKAGINEVVEKLVIK
ncbi:MAG: T9SS type A sorting domain-containing protein [Bacteroidales bacterium]|nr:T9SS type A sorting domain-containing protein [Bacteroidales bacterium]